MKRMTILGAVLLIAARTFGQVTETLEGGGGVVIEPVENAQFDAAAKTTVLNAPDDEAKLTAIRALTPTTRAQSNWLANVEAMTLASLGQEEEAVLAARRISDPEGAAMTELRVRFNSSNFVKAIEVGETWLAKPKEEFSDVYRMRMADAVTKAMKAHAGDTAESKSNSVRVVAGALAAIGHTTFVRHAPKDTVAVSGLVKDLVKSVKVAGAPDEVQAPMFRNLTRVTPVTKKTLKTVGEWKGWLAWHGEPDAETGLVVSKQGTRLLDIHAADEVSRALERGHVTDDAGKSNCVRLINVALYRIEAKTLAHLGYKNGEPLPKVVIRLVRFVQQAGPPDDGRELMLRHLIQITPVTEKTLKTLGEWKGWLARHGVKDVALSEIVESANSLELLNLYAEHAERNVPLPYANSVFGEAYQRRDVAAMRRYLDSIPK